MYFLCFFFSLLFAISHAVPLKDNGLSLKNKGVRNESGINVFSMTLTPVNQTCVGNGQVIFDITNTEPGAVFEFQIYQLPNTSVPIRVTNGIPSTGSTLSHTEGSLPVGNFMFRVIQVVGSDSNEQTANETITANLQTLAFNLALTPACIEQDLTVNVTNGYPVTYELRDTANNIVIAPQASNVFTSVVPGDYIVVVTDQCGDSESLGVTVGEINQDYSSRGGGVFGFANMKDCTTINHIEQLIYGGNAANQIPNYKFPITVQIEVENPTGGSPTIINQTWSSNSDNNLQVDVPFYSGETYNYTATFTDACGITYTRSVEINATRSLRERVLVVDCGTKNILFDNFIFLFEPIQVEVTNYPIGFIPSNYNSDFAPGQFTHTYTTTPSNIRFGTPSSALPEGNYTFEITSCGETFTYNFTISNTNSYTIHTLRYFAGCEDDEGSINFYIRSTASSAQADDIHLVNVVTAPADFVAKYGALPYNVSQNIATDGRFYMNSLPAGDYTFMVSGSCGAPLIYNFTIRSKNLSATVTPSFNCGSFNVEATVTSYLGYEVMWLQKYYPEFGQWGHPQTGVLYTDGDNLSSTTGRQMNTASNNSGNITVTGIVNNIVETGQFRVIIEYRVHSNGNANLTFCREVLDTFNVPQNGGVVLNNYYVANCITGNTELIIDANGVAPLTYRIINYNGSPLLVNNGQDPVFSNLAPGEYTVEIEDACGESRVFEFKTDVVKMPVIVPNNLCVGETATLFVNGLNFLNIQWTKDNDPTVIGTGNTLQLNLFNPTTDSGTYYANLTYNPNPNACLAQTLSFQITAPPSLPEAGTGQTIDIAQSNVGILNLFNYVTAPYDNWGEWTDLSNTGYLNNEVWDASSLPVGQYQFEYLVDGDCLGTDSTIVTINIIASGLTAVQDDAADVCPFIAHTNIINVLDNDNVSGTPVVPSDYTISEETPDTEGIISVNPDGTVDVAAGAQPGQTYTLEYRITENSNVNNFAIGTLTVTTLVDNEDPTFVETLPDAEITVECHLVPDAEVLTATDNCGEATVSLDQLTTPGECTNSYTITRTWTATDLSGNTTEFQQIVNVEDTEAPIPPTAPAAITVECMDDVPVAQTLNAEDNCGPMVEGVVEDIVDDSNPCQIEITRTWTFTDPCGNSDSISQTITVQDTTPPTFDTTPPTDAIVVSCIDDIPAAATITATDNCGDATVYVDELRTDGACFGQFTIERRWVAIDACGNVVTSEPQIITVNDQEGPIFNEALPADITLSCEDEIPAAEQLTATDCTIDIDNDEDVNFRLDGSLVLKIQEAMNGYDTNNGAPFGVVGTWLVNDYLYEGNPGVLTPLPEYDGITFTITTTSLATGTEPSRIRPNSFGNGVDLINARIEITFSDDVFFTANGANFLRAQAYVEASGDISMSVPYPNNGATHDHPNLISSVTGPYVLFNQSPFNPSNIEENAIRTPTPRTIWGGVGTQFTLDHTHPTGQHDFRIYEIQLFPQQDLVEFNEEIVEGDCPGNYEIVRTWTATDACNNITEHVQTITVQDTEAPTFDVAPPTTPLTISCSSDMPNDLVVTASDNCGEVEVFIRDIETPGSCPGNYVIERTYIAIDACGNTTESAPRTITVEDTTAPTFNETLPQDATLTCEDTIPAAVTLTGTESCVFNTDAAFLSNPLAKFINLGDAMAGYDTNNGSPFGVVFQDLPVLDYIDNPTDLDQTYFTGVTFSLETYVLDSSLPSSVTTTPNKGIRFENSGYRIKLSSPQFASTEGNVQMAAGEKVNFKSNNPNANLFFDSTYSTDYPHPDFYIKPTTTGYEIENRGTANINSIYQIFSGADITEFEIENIGQGNGSTFFLYLFNPLMEADFEENRIDGTCPEDYTLERIWTLTDSCGNTQSHTQNIFVTVEDFTLPSNESSTVACIADAVAPVLPEVTDSCGNILTPSAPVISTAPVCEGDLSYTYTYTDCQGNSHDWVYTYTIERADFKMPANGMSAVACPADAVAPVLPLVTDNCGNVLTPSAPVVTELPSPICEGVISYTYTYTDCEGNSHDWVYTYIVERKDFSVPANGSSTVACISEAVAPTSLPTVTDNCGNVLTPISSFIGGTYDGCSGTRTYNYQYQDCEGYNHIWTYEYTINAPVVTLPVNGSSTVSCASEALVVPVAPMVTDNCGRFLIGFLTNVSATPSCAGTKVYTYTYVDCTGTPYIWTHTYTIDAPVVTMPAAGSSTVACVAEAVAPTAPTVVDNCGRALTAVLTNTDADPACSGTKAYTYTYTDCTGTPYTWTHTYTISAPMVTMPANGLSTVACPSDVVAPTVPTVTDNCGNVLTPSAAVISQEPTCEGDITYTYTFTDCEGTTHDWTHTFTIEREDFSVPANTASTVACASAITAPTVPTVTDNCGNVLPPSGPVISQEPACEGDVTYTYTFTDCEGNTHPWTHTFTIEREDFILPANGSETVSCISAAVAPVLPTVTDNCGNVLTPVFSFEGGTYDGCEGTRTFNYEYKDCANHTQTWVYTYIIEAEDFTLPANGSSTVACASEIVAPTVPTVTDNCGNVLTASAPVVSALPSCEGDVTYTYTFTDCQGNSHNWVYTYTIEDTVAPTGTAPSDLVLECMSAIPAADAAAILDEADNCNGSVTVTVSDTDNGGSGCLGNAYIITRTYTLTDCAGNQTDLVQTITVEDSTGPEFVEVLPMDITLECSDSLPAVAELTAVDNCGTATVSFNEERTEGSCPNSYTLERTWTATDACGNTTTHTQVITVEDTTAPEFVGPMPNREVFMRCEDFEPAEILTAVDNCGTASVRSYDEKIEGDCEAKYDILRTWVATDACGNETSYTQTIHLSCPVEIFNAVTPNGDGMNDELILKGINCYPGNVVEVYNRWGVLVYETKDYNSQGNTFKGHSEGRVTVSKQSKLPSGTYYYVVKYTFDLGNGIQYPTEQAGYLHLENNE